MLAAGLGYLVGPSPRSVLAEEVFMDVMRRTVVINDRRWLDGGVSAVPEIKWNE